MTLQDIYQLLAYALFDRRDKYEIKSVGLYSARLGYLWTMDLQQLADTLAGRTVDLTTEREKTWRIMKAQ